ASPAFSASVIVAGNLLIIVLEGLVVSIQTTRLVLFEFFMRFYIGHGRPFRPAAVPPCTGPSEEGDREVARGEAVGRGSGAPGR
ncbi:MAG: hypothetical protein PVF51_09480, partial [Nitrospirota bacterium]